VLLANQAIAGSWTSPPQQAVPANKYFWDYSKNWTTNFGPAYRDTDIELTQLLPCENQFALCFHSGADPFPCTLSSDGLTATCKCMVSTAVNFTLLTAILNSSVYQATLQQCGPKGLKCLEAGSAPVCQALQNGSLIPGADVISTFAQSDVEELEDTVTPPKTCPKGPYAACMTAPCTLDSDGDTASCKCPVFYGRYQLTGSNPQCSLGNNLVPSASYSPKRDPNPFQ
jgi:hypothetical protein